MAHHHDPKGLLIKWDQYHITVWGGMVGFADASHEHAVARCIQGPDGKDIGRKSFNARGCRTKLVEEHEGRRNVLAITFLEKDGSESVRCVCRVILPQNVQHCLSIFYRDSCAFAQLKLTQRFSRSTILHLSARMRAKLSTNVLFLPINEHQANVMMCFFIHRRVKPNALNLLRIAIK